MPSEESPIPARPVTKGPGYHWFGYYDKLQFGPQNRLLLAMQTPFEGRSPRPDDVIHLGYIDLEGGNRWGPPSAGAGPGAGNRAACCSGFLEIAGGSF